MDTYTQVLLCAVDIWYILTCRGTISAAGSAPTSLEETHPHDILSAFLSLLAPILPLLFSMPGALEYYTSRIVLPQTLQ